MIIFIPGEFVTANEYIGAERSNRYAAANIKKFETYRAKLAGMQAKPVKYYPVDLYFTWIRCDRMVDPDNCAFSIKFILDGLVKAKVLVDDGWNQIRSIHHEFVVDKNNLGVEVRIIERSEE
jgi:Holliday junction resolvase RusA-like endonuclease